MNIKDKINQRVPFGTISLTEQAKQNVINCLETKRLTNGELVYQFEQKFAKKFKVKNAIAVSSGTDALTLALASLYDLGARRDDEIIIPALTFVATANAVINAGFVPRFVDIDRHTLNINTQKIEKVVTKRTKAIMPVHLMGKPANMDEIMPFGRKHRLAIIEDCAEAHGAKYNNKYVGSIGGFSCFSLYAAHIVTAIEGGMILTDSTFMSNIIRTLRNHGLTLVGNDWEFNRIGFSSKMNEIEAAIGLGNLEIFDEIYNKRRQNLYYLMDNFLQFKDYFITIKEELYEQIGPHAFPIIIKEHCKFTKKDLTDYLLQAGIDYRNLFYSIPTQCRGYRFLGYRLGSFPEAEHCSNNGIHIGVHQDLTIEQLDYIVDTIKKFLKKYE